MNGLQEVKCRDCGASLGAQDERVPVDWEMWQHNRCPARTAKSLGMTREAYDLLFKEVTASIYAAFPDFPNNLICTGPNEETGARKVRTLRAEIAAGMVLENLGYFKYQISDPDKENQS